MSDPAPTLSAVVTRELSAREPIRIGLLIEAVCTAAGVSEDDVREAVWRLIDQGAVEVNHARQLRIARSHSAHRATGLPT